MRKRFAEHLCPILNIHHPSVRFLFKISALPVGLPSTPDLGTWSARGRETLGGVKWEKDGGQGEKTLYEDLQEGDGGGGGFRVLHADTNNVGERSDGSHHPASVLKGAGVKGGDLKSRQRRPLQLLNTSFVP